MRNRLSGCKEAHHRLAHHQRHSHRARSTHTQYKVMLRQVTNALRSIALVMEQLDNDARGDRIAD